MTGRPLDHVRRTLARQINALNARRRGKHNLPALFLLTDDTRDVDWLEAVNALPPRAGVIVRHRDKQARSALAFRLRAICRARRVLLLVSEDIELAVRVKADGVHFPQGQMARMVRARQRNRRWVLTTSVHDERAMHDAERCGASAVFVSPIFSTRSHPLAAHLGVVRMAMMMRGSRIPHYALGGINGETIKRVRPISLAGIGLIGAWVSDVRN